MRLRMMIVWALLFCVVARKRKEPPPEGPVDCSAYINNAAHKWVAAFKSINIKPWSKELFTEFYAAPPHYCFESYEIRLHPHESAEVKQSAIIPASELYSEKFGNVTVKLGNFTFENVSVGTYDVGLIPIERSQRFLAGGTKRCLCPTNEITDPSHHSKIVCSCTEAKWNNVEMYNPTTPPTPPVLCAENPGHASCTPLINTQAPKENASPPGLLVFGGMVGFGLLAMLIGCVILAAFWRRYRRKGTPLRLRLEPHDGGPSAKFVEGCGGAALGAARVAPVRLLILYSHDSPAHERAVHALAEYLQKQAFCEVEMDAWAMRELVRNKTDWVFGSIRRADKVLILNSAGAAFRYSQKLAEPAFRLQRAEASSLDDLFLLQLDVAAQAFADAHDYAKFLSAHFHYTPDEFQLPNVAPLVRFQLPGHLGTLAANLHSVRASELPSTHPLGTVNAADFARSPEGARLAAAVEDAAAFVRAEPEWFARLHVKRPVAALRPDEAPGSSSACAETASASSEEAIELGASRSSGSADSGLSSLTSSFYAAAPPPPPPSLAAPPALPEEEEPPTADSGFQDEAQSRLLERRPGDDRRKGRDELLRKADAADPARQALIEGPVLA